MPEIKQYGFAPIQFELVPDILIPAGITLWLPDEQWYRWKFLSEVPLDSTASSYLSLVDQKLWDWAVDGIPYDKGDRRPWMTAWWEHAKNLLIHRVKLGFVISPFVDAGGNKDQLFEELFRSYVSDKIEALKELIKNAR